MLRLVDTQTSLDGRIGLGEIREPAGKPFRGLCGEEDVQIGIRRGRSTPGSAGVGGRLVLGCCVVASDDRGGKKALAKYSLRKRGARAV